MPNVIAPGHVSVHESLATVKRIEGVARELAHLGKMLFSTDESSDQ